MKYDSHENIVKHMMIICKTHDDNFCEDKDNLVIKPTIWNDIRCIDIVNRSWTHFCLSVWPSVCLSVCLSLFLSLSLSLSQNEVARLLHSLLLSPVDHKE